MVCHFLLHPAWQESRFCGAKIACLGRQWCKRKIVNIITRTMKNPAVLVVLVTLFGSAQFSEAQAQVSVGRINDSGVAVCANASSNSVPCGHADGDLYGFPRQDGEMGRSAAEAAAVLSAKTGTSDASVKGFDFSKVLNDAGATVRTGTNQVGVFSDVAPGGTRTSDWICARDNITRLIWLLPGTSGTNNFRKNSNTYTWYNATTALNGGQSGTVGPAVATQECSDANGQAVVCCYGGSTCDTTAVTALAPDAACKVTGSGSWRLPTRLELMSLIDYSKTWLGVGAVDPTFFANVLSASYWTSEVVAGNPLSARTVHMGNGVDGIAPKAAKRNVMLVRTTP